MIHLATDAGRRDIPVCPALNVAGQAGMPVLLMLAGLTRLELAISASTVQRFVPTKLQPQSYEVGREDLFTRGHFGFWLFYPSNFQGDSLALVCFSCYWTCLDRSCVS